MNARLMCALVAAMLSFSHLALADVAVTNLANNVSTSNGFSTGSLTWAGGSRGVVFAASSADSASLGGITAHAVSGGDVMWSEIGHIQYGSRRAVSVLVSDGTPSNGALTITASTSDTYQETQWSVEQLTGFDAASWPATSTEAASTNTSVNAPDVGTIDTGDLVLAGAGFEGATDDLAPAAGSSQHVLRQNGGNVRSLLVMTSTTDDTPGVTWTTNGNGAGVVAILIPAAAGGGGSLLLMRRRR